MKKLALLLGSALMLGACAHQQTAPTAQNATKGILLCELGELCPVIKVNWNAEDKSQVQLHIYLDNPASYYDIKAVVFNNGQISYAYKPSSTNQEFTRGFYRSGVTIDTPPNLMAKLKGTPAASMNIITDKGEIKRYIYKDGKASSAYAQFVQAYTD
ncbi:hypothetical protein [Acinetobacter rudis]|uniref:hypothetical protein n=1 Tax=Acinetobacter rudis TaxID=632955 RepID=UPI003340B5B5